MKRHVYGKFTPVLLHYYTLGKMNKDKQLMSNKIKHKIYLNEYNVPMGNTVYLPLVSGLLRAFAETFSMITDNYEFMPFMFRRGSVETLLDQYQSPAVAAFTLSMWNEQLNLQLASEVKRRFPDCLIVFGGPQVPHRPQDYFKKYPFVDVAVRGEGEDSFAEILIRYTETNDFSAIPGISWRHPETDECVYNEELRPIRKNLDEFPSPYLEGLYDNLFTTHDDLRFQAILETNRGCPFPCTFCFWGQGGLNTRMRFHSVERVAQEFEWCAKHEIEYIFNADANFGMYKQDFEIAQRMVEIKSQYGYPDKFRSCFGKNTDDKIFEVATLLHTQGLEKGITLARQSNTADVLVNIKRKNIKLETYRSLQARFDAIDIPVYTEMILGLPGETYESWVEGIEDILESALRNQLFIYMCQVYPNTELADPDYRERFGLVTQQIPLHEVHASIRTEEGIEEYEHIIVETNMMPADDWERAVIFSWVTMLFHSMKLGFFLLSYLADRVGMRFTDLICYICESELPDGSILAKELEYYREQVEFIRSGHGRCRVMPEYGEIYWDEEEASFLRISSQLDQFYMELEELIRRYLDGNGLDYESAELAEAIQYQRLRIPGHYIPEVVEYEFNYNFPEYYETRFLPEPTPFQKDNQILTLIPKEFEGDKLRYARETILWGRKSSTMLTNVTWRQG